MTIRRSPALLAATLVACGGDSGGDLDASPRADARPVVDGRPGDCHDEQDDAANDVAAEPTGFTAGDLQVRICGRIDERDPAEGLVDLDLYRVGAGAPPRVMVRVLADGGLIEVVAAELYSSFDDVIDGADPFLGAARVIGNHGVFVADAGDGEYLVAVAGFHPVRPDDAVDYEVRIVADDPDLRCLDAAATDYVEQLDSAAGNAENDVVRLITGFPLTPSPADMPEPSGPDLTIAPLGRYRVDGAIGPHAQPLEENYLDRDAYVVATGTNTNQLDVRVRWEDGATPSDLDWFLFDDNGDQAPLLVQLAASIDNPEFESAAVLPSSTYWLVVASYQGSAATQAYAVTVCGSQFAP